MRLSEKYMRGAKYSMLLFLTHYPNRWHSFSTDKITPQVVAELEKDNAIEVSHETNQMRLVIREG